MQENPNPPRKPVFGDIHELKTWPEYFQAVMRGKKTFEVRKADRDFKVNDILRLLEWNPETEEFTGKWVQVHIRYILKGGQFGIEEGFSVIGFK